MKRSLEGRKSMAKSKWSEIQTGLDDFQWKIAVSKAEAGVRGAKGAGGRSCMLHGEWRVYLDSVLLICGLVTRPAHVMAISR